MKFKLLISSFLFLALNFSYMAVSRAVDYDNDLLSYGIEFVPPQGAKKERGTQEDLKFFRFFIDQDSMMNFLEPQIMSESEFRSGIEAYKKSPTTVSVKEVNISNTSGYVIDELKPDSSSPVSAVLASHKTFIRSYFVYKNGKGYMVSFTAPGNFSQLKERTDYFEKIIKKIHIK